MAEQKKVWDRLRSLFSNDVIVKTTDGKLKVIDANERQQSNINFLKDRFIRMHKAYEYSATEMSMAYQYNRHRLFREYDAMDMDSIIASALDILADETTVENEHGNILTIQSDDEDIKDRLENLFFDIMNVDFNLWPWTRSLVKYGDLFLALEITEKYGIINVHPQSVYYTERIEGYDPNDSSKVKFKVENDPLNKGEYDNFEVAHFRLLGDANFIPYGKSVLENARRVWKQLCLTGESKVWTDSGYKYIKDIKVGDSVYSYDYSSNSLKSTKVKNHKYTGNRPVYEIKTAHRTIRGTEEHPIMVQNGVYKNIGDLSTNDYIIIGNHTVVNDGELPTFKVDEDLFVANFNEDFYSKNLSNNKQVCKECGVEYDRLTGNHLKTHNMNIDEYYDKFGIDETFSSLLHRNERISYKTAIKYCDDLGIPHDSLDVYLNRCQNKIVPENLILKNLPLFVRFIGFLLGDGWVEDHTVCFSLGDKLNKSMKYVELMDLLNVSYRIRNEGLSKADCVVSSTYLKALLTDVLGFRTGTLNKVVPDWVYKLPLELRREFMYGFADADGTPLNNNAHSVSGVNKILIEGLHTLAQQSGFTTTNIAVGVDSRPNRKDSYHFQFRDSQYHMQLDDNGVLIEKIRSITPLQADDVYDIEVDDDLHNFVVNGVIAHNCLMEDAMLIHRIMRAPEKRVFKIDIGGINPTEIDNYMRKIIDRMKKTPFVDKQTGDYNLKYNMQNLTEDFYLPVRGGDSGTSIENLGGLEYSAIEDIEYLQQRLFAALKVPKAYLSYTEDLSGKATLAAHDVRFARTIHRIQKVLISELTKVALIHLLVQGIDESQATNFQLSLTNSSTIYDQELLNIWGQKIGVARDMKDLKMFSDEFIYKTIFKMGKHESDTERGEIVNDLKQRFRFNSIENEGNDPAAEAEKEPTDVEGELEELKKSLDGRNKPNDGNGGGRPRDVSSYKKDRHSYGRDPIGSEENSKSLSRVSENVLKHSILKFLKNRNNKKTMLNEDNLIEDTEL